MQNKLTLLLATILLTTSLSLGQTKPDKNILKFEQSLLKPEESFANGDYKAAKNALIKAKKKITAKLGGQNQFTASMLLMEAKYDLGLGMPKDFEANLQSAVRASEKLNSENSEKHAVLLLDAAELYNQNGSFRVAREFLENAQKLIDIGTFNKDAIRIRQDIILAESMVGQGYWNDAIRLARSREAYYAKRAVKQETIPDGKGGLKSRKIPEAELNQRMNDYARVLTLIGNAYGRQGNLKSADSAFGFASAWIKKNINDHSIAYIRNQFYNAVMLVENGVEDLPKSLEYDRTLTILKAYFYPSHFLGVPLYEEYLKELLRDNETAKYANTKAEYERLIGKEFPEKSIYNVRLKAVEFDKSLDAEKTVDLEKKAVSLLSNTTTLPRNNILTAETLDFLAELAVRQKNYGGADKYLKEIIEIKTDLYGAAAPELHLARLHLANFYLDNTNKITLAGEIYTDSYSGVLEKEIGAWHKDHLDLLNHLAQYYEMSDQYTKAVAALDKAALVARGKYNDKDYKYGEELTRIARLQIRLGQYELMRRR